MSMRNFIMIFVAASVLAAQTGDADVMLQRAIRKEIVEGDLKGAIDLYKRVVVGAAKNRGAGAKALLHLGQCYEKQGNTEAQKVYERIIREFGDQKEVAVEAGARISAVGRAISAHSGVTVRQVWSGNEVDITGTISPDGRYLTYDDRKSGGYNLAVRDLVTGQQRRLGKVVNEAYVKGNPLFSPDGKQLVYQSFGKGAVELRIIGLDGSGDRAFYTLAGDMSRIFPCGWSPDGKRILATLPAPRQTTARIAWISIADGSDRIVKTKQDPFHYTRLALSPDGRFIAYDVTRAGSKKRSIFVVSADGARDVALVESRWDDYVVGWAPDGNSILFASDRSGPLSVWLIPVKDGTANGSPMLVKKDLGIPSVAGDFPSLWPMGMSRNGTFYYGTGVNTSEIYSVSIDPQTGNALGKPSALAPSNDLMKLKPAWSPDGRQLAYHSVLGSYRGEYPKLIHLYSADTRVQRDLNPSVEFVGNSTRWSPDSRSLLLDGLSTDGKIGVYRVDTQSGHAEMLFAAVDSTARPIFTTYSRDGKTIYYCEDPTGPSRRSPPRLRSRNLESGEDKVFYEPSEGNLTGVLELSPDGRSLAFKVRTKESVSLMVMPASGGQPREVLRSAANTQTWYGLAWSSDGRYLYNSARKDRGSPWDLWRVPVEGGAPQQMGVGMAVDTMSVHPNGREIVFSEFQRRRFQVWAMENFLPR